MVVLLANLADIVDNFSQGDSGMAVMTDLTNMLPPPGFVLELLLWNIMYNEVANLPAPGEATVVGYADNIALVVVAKFLKDADLV